MIGDMVADSLIRIKNGYLSKKTEVDLRYSKLVLAIAHLLVEEGYIASVRDGAGKITVMLKYDNRKPVMTDVRRISKPGLRVYKGKDALPWVLNGLGIAIVSTPKGVMTDKKARKEGVGGEIMAYVW